MSYYLVQASYAPAAMSSILRSPQDQPQLVREVIEKLGGSLDGFWFALGDYDVVAICHLPGVDSIAAFSMAVLAGGGVREIKTTPLLTWTEGLDAMKRAAEAGYTAAAGSGSASMTEG